MAETVGQLSMVDRPRVELAYHPDLQAPDARGPEDYGVFTATLADGLSVHGWGRTDALALADLARGLRTHILDAPASRSLTATDQALIAAQLLPDIELERWLAEHASEPVLHDASSPPEQPR